MGGHGQKKQTPPEIKSLCTQWQHTYSHLIHAQGWFKPEAAAAQHEEELRSSLAGQSLPELGEMNEEGEGDAGSESDVEMSQRTLKETRSEIQKYITLIDTIQVSFSLSLSLSPRFSVSLFLFLSPPSLSLSSLSFLSLLSLYLSLSLPSLSLFKRTPFSSLFSSFLPK